MEDQSQGLTTDHYLPKQNNEQAITDQQRNLTNENSIDFSGGSMINASNNMQQTSHITAMTYEP